MTELFSLGSRPEKKREKKKKTGKQETTKKRENKKHQKNGKITKTTKKRENKKQQKTGKTKKQQKTGKTKKTTKNWENQKTTKKRKPKNNQKTGKTKKQPKNWENQKTTYVFFMSTATQLSRLSESGRTLLAIPSGSHSCELPLCLLLGTPVDGGGFKKERKTKKGRRRKAWRDFCVITWYVIF